MSFLNVSRLYVLTSLLSSCATGPDPIQLSYLDNRTRVTASPGQEADVLLQSIGVAEYGDPIISSDAVHFLGAEQQGRPNPGGPLLLYRFLAVKVATVQIEIPRESSAPGPPLEGFHLEVMVTHDAAGH
jgi:hypothetical protein